MGWNNLSIPKLQWCNWSLETDKWIHSTLHWACDYLFLLGLKLVNVNESGPQKTGTLHGNLDSTFSCCCSSKTSATTGVFKIIRYLSSIGKDFIICTLLILTKIKIYIHVPLSIFLRKRVKSADTPLRSMCQLALYHPYLPLDCLTYADLVDVWCQTLKPLIRQTACGIW